MPWISMAIADLIYFMPFTLEIERVQGNMEMCEIIIVKSDEGFHFSNKNLFL